LLGHRAQTSLVQRRGREALRYSYENAQLRLPLMGRKWFGFVAI
jgi:hypothetical protein